MITVSENIKIRRIISLRIGTRLLVCSNTSEKGISLEHVSESLKLEQAWWKR